MCCLRRVGNCSAVREAQNCRPADGSRPHAPSKVWERGRKGQRRMASLHTAHRLGDASRTGSPPFLPIRFGHAREDLALKPAERSRLVVPPIFLWLAPTLLLCAAPASTRAQLASAAHTPPLSAFDSAKAESLMRTRVPCLGCHALNGSGGRIAPDLTHVASRRSAAYIRAIVTDPAGVLPGTTMPRIPMPAPVRELLIAYLSAGAASSALDTSPPRAARVGTRDGTNLYAQNCAACHGERGKGDGPNARYLPIRPAAHADPVTMSARSDDRLFDAVYGGGYPLGRSAMMPAFGATLTRQEIWSLVRHMRALCRCEGPRWSQPSPASPNGARPGSP